MEQLILHLSELGGTISVCIITVVSLVGIIYKLLDNYKKDVIAKIDEAIEVIKLVQGNHYDK
jgi:hypothetical protein